MAVYTINFDTMIEELCSRLEVPRGAAYPGEARLKRWINLGIIEFARRSKAVHIVKFLYLSSGIHRYTCPDDWLRAQAKQVLYLRSGVLSGYQYPLKQVDRRGMQALIGTVQANFLSAGSYNTPAQGYPLRYLLDGGVIEFDPIPSSAAAGANRVCFKYPGIPDAVDATSATCTAIPLEYRMLPVDYAQHLGETMDKNPNALMTLARFEKECERVASELAWADMESPPSLMPEEYFQTMEWNVI